ncbi:MAG TPA: cation diffusion facilitator family transporter [Bacteroidia bacterium]|nr:cation diffusion facilitator family transporter [Bacteroidia bacterium]
MNHSQHHHKPRFSTLNKAFTLGIALNLAFVVLEAIIGFSVHSLALLSDAGHNLADAGALAFSLLAFRLQNVQPNPRYTYGYRKSTLLVALFNALVLMASVGAIAYEAAHRFFEPQVLPGKTIALVAAIGILVNAATALLFMKEKDKDLNVKSAYLHLMSDALVSLGVVAGGITMAYTNLFWIDAVLSAAIALVILFSTWNLLKESFKLSLDGVPSGIHIDELRALALGITGVCGLHHVHVWALSSNENALTAHLVLKPGLSSKQEQNIKSELRHKFEHLNIRHITLETESDDQSCENIVC